jgi:hypothetical protein
LRAALRIGSSGLAVRLALAQRRADTAGSAGTETSLSVPILSPSFAVKIPSSRFNFPG